MKKQILTVVALFVALGTTYAQHNHGTNDKKEGSKMDHSMHQGMKNSPDNITTFDVPVEFRDHLGKVYESSLELTESFVAGENITSNAEKVMKTLKEVDMGLLNSNEAHMEWMMNLKEMNTSLNEVISVKDRAAQQVAFNAFNQALYRSIKAFGISGGTAYYQYCPMALDNNGAHWFSDTKEIRNPYFGDKMLKCGSVKETIN